MREVAVRPSGVYTLGTTGVTEWSDAFSEEVLDITGGVYPLAVCPVAFETQSTRPRLPGHGLFVSLAHDLPGIRAALDRRDTCLDQDEVLGRLPSQLFTQCLRDGGLREPGRVVAGYYVSRRRILQAVARVGKITTSEKANHQLARLGWRVQGRDALDVLVLCMGGATGSGTVLHLLRDLARQRRSASRLVVLIDTGDAPPDAKEEAFANAAGILAGLAVERDVLGDTHLVMFGFRGAEERPAAIRRSARFVAHLLTTGLGEQVWGQIVNGLVRSRYTAELSLALVGAAEIRALTRETADDLLASAASLTLKGLAGPQPGPGTTASPALPAMTADDLLRLVSAHFGVTPYHLALRTLKGADDLPAAIRAMAERCRTAFGSGALQLDAAPNFLDALVLADRERWLTARASELRRAGTTMEGALLQEVAPRIQQAREDLAYWSASQGSSASGGRLARFFGQAPTMDPRAVKAQVELVQLEGLRAALPAMASALLSAASDAEAWLATTQADQRTLQLSLQLALQRQQDAAATLHSGLEGDAHGIGISAADPAMMAARSSGHDRQDHVAHLANRAATELLSQLPMGVAASQTPEELLQTVVTAVARNFTPPMATILDALDHQRGGAAQFLATGLLEAARPKVDLREADALIDGVHLEPTFVVEVAEEMISRLGTATAELAETGESLVFLPSGDPSSIAATALLYAVPVGLLVRVEEWAAAWQRFDDRQMSLLHTPLPLEVERVREVIGTWARLRSWR